MVEPAVQNDLFKSARIEERHSRTFAQNGVREKTNPYSHRHSRKGRANMLHDIAHIRARAPAYGLFAAGDDDLAELQFTLRQVMNAVAELTRELTWHQAKVAPWWELWREFCDQHQEMVAAEGFKVGGQQAAFRSSAVRQLDVQREGLKANFTELSRLQGEVKILKARARGIQTEIKIVKNKQRRSA